MSGVYRLAALSGYFYNLYMRTSLVAGLVFLATATLAQQQQTVEITSEPSHHLVLQNESVRVFDVTVAPKARTMIHRHNSDYLCVTLGDSDLVNVRVGEQPVPLQLKDGEVRYTPGGFAHTAVNNSEQPFHNITIELLKPSTSVKACSGNCDQFIGCTADASGAATGKPDCPNLIDRISSDQWKVSWLRLPPSATIQDHFYKGPHLLVAVTPLDLTSEIGGVGTPIKRDVGGLIWAPTGTAETLKNNTTKAAQIIILEFGPDKQ